MSNYPYMHKNNLQVKTSQLHTCIYTVQIKLFGIRSLISDTRKSLMLQRHNVSSNVIIFQDKCNVVKLQQVDNFISHTCIQ